jgi:hypothetical protein
LKPLPPLTALVALMLACGDGASGPNQPPNPPDGLSLGTAAYTTEKDGQPATQVAYSATAQFPTHCPGQISLGNSPYIQFSLGVDSPFTVRTYTLGDAPNWNQGIVSVIGSHTYPRGLVPTPTTGWLQVLYASGTRVDGRFEFRGGADSALVSWVVLVRGSFSATPHDPPPQCPW